MPLRLRHRVWHPGINKRLNNEIQKLSKLLQLSDRLAILSAKILLLRITVPADLYKSGISLEVQGFQVRMHADPEETGSADVIVSHGQRSRAHAPSEGAKEDRAKNNQSHVHDPGGLYGGVDTLELLPTPVDLATSFLRAEPKEERAELRAAIANSQYLDRLHVNDEEEDEVSALGFGNTLSLPAFLADFLKGVGDRIEVKIKDLELDLHLKIDSPSEASNSSDISDRSEAVTVRVCIGDIALDGVADRSSLKTSMNDPTIPAPYSQEFRRLSIANIEAMFISEAASFTNFARSAGPSSPRATHTDRLGTPKSKTTMSSLSVTTPKAKTSAIFEDETKVSTVSQDQRAFIFSRSSDTLENAHDGHESPEQMMSIYSSTHRKDPYQESMLSDSFYSSRGDGESGELRKEGSSFLAESPVDPNKYHHKDLPRAGDNPLESARHEALDHAETSMAAFDGFVSSSTSPNNFLNEDQDSSSQGNSIIPSDFGNLKKTDCSPLRNHSSLGSTAAEQDSDSVSHSSEDLSQSKIFSHEEVESMYMSAISHTFDSEADASQSLPGQWGASGSTNEDKIEETAIQPQVDMQQHGSLGLLCQPRSPASGLGLISNQADPGKERCVTLNFQADRNVCKSVSQLGFDLQKETSYLNSPIEDGTSPRDREICSGDFKSPLVTAKWILFVDSIVTHLSVESTTALIPAESQAYQKSTATTKRFPDDFETNIHEDVWTPGDDTDTSHSRLFDISDREESPCQILSMKIGVVRVLADLGLTKMTILVIDQLTTRFLPLDPQKESDGQLHLRSPQSNKTELQIRSICWEFLDSVRGVPVTGSQFPNPTDESRTWSKGSEVLFRADVKGFAAAYSRFSTSYTLKMFMQKFTFGYPLDDVLSFDNGIGMKDSTRDTFAPSDDIVLCIVKSSGSLKIELRTLPLHVTLDLRKLDEIFGCFGGLSSILGLGSSMVSTVTVVDAKSKPYHTQSSTRGVHFESPGMETSNRARTADTQTKVTARIGGLVFDLQGSQSCVRLETSAMKIVNRTEGLGLQIDRLHFSVLHQEEFAESPPSVAGKISNLRVEYLPIPNEVDLARLLALLSPSKGKVERDDDILLDTLLRQRQQGGVVRATAENLECRVSDIDELSCFPPLVEDLKRFSTVTKYLPEDDRPGILTLGLVRKFKIDIKVNESFGVANMASENVEMAHVSIPSLTALGINVLRLHRNQFEELVGPALPVESNDESHLPMIMARFIGNEMEPTAKFKLHNARVEYHVSTFMAIMDKDAASATEAVVADIASSVATFTGRNPARGSLPKISSQSFTRSVSTTDTKSLRLDVTIRDSILGLNPRDSQAKGVVVLTDTHFVGVRPKEEDANATLDIQKASIMVIDNSENIAQAQTTVTQKTVGGPSNQTRALASMGYVSISLISSAKATLQVVKQVSHLGKAIDIEIRDDLFVLESCADSTQTLKTIMNGLLPPLPPSNQLRYKTQVVPVENMLASLSGRAFDKATEIHDEEELLPLGLDEGDMVNDEISRNLEFASSFYNRDPDAVYNGMADSMLEDDLESLAAPSVICEIGDKNLQRSFQEQIQIAPGNETLDFQDDHFAAISSAGATGPKWNNKQNACNFNKDFELRGIFLNVRVRDVHIIWNLFDGYDWQSTRNVISQAVEDVQVKATEHSSRTEKRKSLDVEEEAESLIGDFLFNSIYIGVPANRDPRELAQYVNRNIDDLASETESYATSSSSDSPSRQGHAQRTRFRKLRLKRSKYHKMTFELKGISADWIIFPPDSGEAQSSIDVRIQDLEIFDHVPTSTWKKFATYMHDAGERESGTSMIHLEILNVKPVPNLAASEIILKVSARMSDMIVANTHQGYHASAPPSCRPGCS